MQGRKESRFNLLNIRRLQKCKIGQMHMCFHWNNHQSILWSNKMKLLIGQKLILLRPQVFLHQQLMKRELRGIMGRWMGWM